MNRITLEPGKRGGKPCIRGLRITVYDILSQLSKGASQEEILEDFPELEAEDILAALSFAADRERKVYSVAVWFKTTHPSRSTILKILLDQQPLIHEVLINQNQGCIEITQTQSWSHQATFSAIYAVFWPFRMIACARLSNEMIKN